MAPSVMPSASCSIFSKPSLTCQIITEVELARQPGHQSKSLDSPGLTLLAGAFSDARLIRVSLFITLAFPLAALLRVFCLLALPLDYRCFKEKNYMKLSLLELLWAWVGNGIKACLPTNQSVGVCGEAAEQNIYFVLATARDFISGEIMNLIMNCHRLFWEDKLSACSHNSPASSAEATHQRAFEVSVVFGSSLRPIVCTGTAYPFLSFFW